MINDTRRDAVYEEMNRYVLELGDPAQYGPRYYIDKIAICRNYLNSVSLVISELSREKLIYTSELRKLEAIYDLESARLLATDEHVRRLANIKDRESTIVHLLRDKRQRIDFLKDQLLTIDALVKYVSHRNRELNSTMDAIKNQRRFMQIEVQTGAFYGDERVPDHEIGMGPAGVSMDFNEKELRETMADVPEEIAAELESAVGVAPPPVRVEVPAPPTPEVQLLDEAEAIRQLLGDRATTDEPSKSAPQAEVEDYSSLLDSV